MKEQIFKQCLKELDKTQLIGENPEHEDAEYELQASRFKALFELIDILGVSEEYEEWRMTNKTSMEAAE
jgi:hypothetical protein